MTPGKLLNEKLTPEVIRDIADRMKKAPDPDYWHAAMAVALDAGETLEAALDFADKACQEERPDIDDTDELDLGFADYVRE